MVKWGSQSDTGNAWKTGTNGHFPDILTCKNNTPTSERPCACCRLPIRPLSHQYESLKLYSSGLFEAQTGVAVLVPVSPEPSSITGEAGVMSVAFMPSDQLLYLSLSLFLPPNHDFSSSHVFPITSSK